MEERATKERTAEKKLLQWHPAFYASIQIELSEEADKLIFERAFFSVSQLYCPCIVFKTYFFSYLLVLFLFTEINPLMKFLKWNLEGGE